MSKTAVARLAATALAAGLVLLGPSRPALSADAPVVVSIRAELDLLNPTYGGVGPRTFEVVDVVAGPQVELTAANQTANPSNWAGAVSVDVDPVAKTVTVTGDDDGNFDSARVVISSTAITGLTAISDTLFNAPAGALTRVVSGGGGAPVQVLWQTGDSDSYNVKGSAVFSYTSPLPPVIPPPAPTAFTAAAAPSISGKATVGRKLKARNVSASVFTPTPSRIKLQWFRGSAKVPGATKASYRITRADVGKRVKLKVTVSGSVPTRVYTVKSKKVSP